MDTILAVLNILAQVEVESTSNGGLIIVYSLVGIIVGGVVGYFIGKWKNRVALGVILGAILGCLGWIIVAIIPKNENI